MTAPKDFFADRLKEVGGIACFAFAVYLLISLVSYNPADPSLNNATASLQPHNSGGLLGAYLADWFLQFFGLAGFAPSLLLTFLGVALIRHQNISFLTYRLTTIPFLLIGLAALSTFLAPIADWPTSDGIGNGGLVGKLIAINLLQLIGGFGALAITTIITLLCVLWLSGLSLEDIYLTALRVRTFIVYLGKVAYRFSKRFQFKKSFQIDLPLQQKTPKPKLKKKKLEVERPTTKPKNERAEKEKQSALPLNLNDDYSLPPLHLLEERQDDTKPEPEEALTQNARQIEAQLKNFGVEGQVTKVRPGPVITIYELEPAAGVKMSAVVNLADDLARSMSATAIRVAPIPGRNVIGIELPNRNRRTVSFKELLSSQDFETHAGKLAVAMGVDTGGAPIYADISKMPHALIAGTTGSGKSVAMNAFILSLLYRLTPEQLRFVMIDPKMLELSIYNDIPHLLTPVITDPNKAATALKWVVKEMEDRYKLMSELGVKNLQSFNAKFSEMQAAGETPTRLVQVGFDPATGKPRMEKKPLAENTLPYIVVVIDELADLMMVAGKQVEVYIARLAQMARAAGIHLLVATQRPSVDVVTGLIKANIPTRISFNVTSKIDSRTVLDQMGAEQLLGKGDMLYMANGENNLQRLHGAFVTEDECNGVADHLRQQGEPGYIDDIFKTGSTPSADGSETTDDDPLYQEAIGLVAREQKASTSFIQRHLKIGYNKAAGLIDKMEADGLIGAADHVGKREVVMRKPPEDGY